MHVCECVYIRANAYRINAMHVGLYCVYYTIDLYVYKTIYTAT